MSDNYNRHQEGCDPFNWIKLHLLMDDQIIKNYIFDHAGEGETLLLMALWLQKELKWLEYLKILLGILNQQLIHHQKREN